MEPVDPNEDGYDPNEPDCTNGDFFCRLCLSTMNSESMWFSHTAGRRHIKNAQKYPKGLPKRMFIDDEDSYERPPKRERFDDGYDLKDDFPRPRYEDKYYGDEYYKIRPPMDYEPVVKPNLVFDYGHTKKLKETIPPPEMNKIAAAPPSVVLPSASATPHLLAAKSGGSLSLSDGSLRLTSDEAAILDQLLLKSVIEKHQPQVKDDFFEKINQREIAKEIARELSKTGLLFNSSEKKAPKADAPKAHSSRDVYDKHDRRKPDSFPRNNNKKPFSLEKIKESMKKIASTKMSSSKSKSVLDDLDPDKLTPDDLDALLSANLKPKKKDSSVEICNKKHCVKNEIDLDDPKIIAKKLEMFSTIDFLKIIHKKLVNLDLKSPEELKLLLKVIAEAQVAVSKKLPPDLQALVNAKLSGKDGETSQLPDQDTLVSQNHSVASSVSSNTISKISVASVPSSAQTTVSVNPVPTPASLQIPPVPFSPLIPPPIINIPVSQNSASSISNIVLQQNQVPFPYPSSVISTIPTMTPVQMATMPTPVRSVTSVNYPASVQNFQSQAMLNYYNMIRSVYQNRQVEPPKVQNIGANQQLSAVPKFQPHIKPPPPIPSSLSAPPPPPPPPSRSQLSQEVLDAIIRIRKQTQLSEGQPNQQSSTSRNSQSNRDTKMLDTLKNLELLEKEFKSRKEQK